MASLWAMLSAPDATSAYQWLTRLARGLGADDPRGMDARRADLLADLLTGGLTIVPDQSGPIEQDEPNRESADGGGCARTAARRRAPARRTRIPGGRCSARSPRESRWCMSSCRSARSPAPTTSPASSSATARSRPTSPVRSRRTPCGGAWSPTRSRAPCSITAAPSTTRLRRWPTSSGLATSTAASPPAAAGPSTPSSTTPCASPTARRASRTCGAAAPTTTRSSTEPAGRSPCTTMVASPGPATGHTYTSWPHDYRPDPPRTARPPTGPDVRPDRPRPAKGPPSTSSPWDDIGLARSAVADGTGDDPPPF